jgi:hypothetical protein
VRAEAEEAQVTRFTFVIQIQPDGPSTLENLSTQERVRVSNLATVGSQIERWLDSLTREQDQAMPEKQEERE